MRQRGFLTLFVTLLIAASVPVLAQAQGRDDTGILPGMLPDAPQLGPVEMEFIGRSSHDIVQDHEGFLWFAGDNGLSRFDGYDYTLYQNNPEDSTSLSTNRLECLLVDRDGTLWIGTFGAGLNRFDEATGHFTRFVHDPNDPTSLSQDTVTALLEDRNGTLWVGTHRGLNRLDRETGRFAHYFHDPDDPTSLSNNQARVLYEDSRGTLWVGTGSPDPAETPEGEGGLNRFDPASNTFTQYVSKPGDPTSLISNDVMSILEDSRGTFWVGTSGDGLHTMDREKGTFTRLEYDPKDPTKLSRSYFGDDESYRESCAGWVCGGVGFIHEDSEGLIWFGGLRSGVTRYDPASGVINRYGESMEIGDLWDMEEAHDGTLWIAGWSGTFKVTSSANVFPHYEPGISDDSEPGDLSIVLDILEDQKGRLWVSALGLGLLKFDESNGSFEPPVAEDGKAIGFSSQIRSIFEDAEGVLWLTGYQRIGRYDPSTGSYRSYESPPSVEVIKDRRGRLWSATISYGVRITDSATGAPLFDIQHESGNPASLTNDFISTVLEDRRGGFWVGTASGLDHLTRDPDEGGPAFDSYLPGRWISAAYEDREGRFWVGTWGDGLYLLDRDTGLLKHYGPEEGLSVSNVASIVEDNDGLLWLATDDGGTFSRPTNGRLSRFDPTTGVFTNFGPDDGLPETVFVPGGAARGQSGILYFSGLGFTAFNPSSIREPSRNPPKMALTNLRIFNDDVVPGPGSPLEKPIQLTKRVVLNHDQNDVTIDYAGLSFRDSDRLQYRYQLEPQETGWVSARTNRSARYSGLAPGSYTFSVEAVDSRGVRSVENATLEVVILPPWWRTTWAYILYVLLFGGAVFAVDRFQRARLIRKERERMREMELVHAREIEKAYHELRDAKDRLVQQEKLASLGQLTAGIAHEIKNPLNFITNFAKVNEELADEAHEELADLPDALERVGSLLQDMKQNAGVISQHGQRADSIVRSMMEHASTQPGAREVTDTNTLVQEYADLALHAAKARNPDFECELEVDLDDLVPPIPLVQQEIGKVLMNLLSNAFDAVREKGQTADGPYTPRVTVRSRNLDGSVEIRVGDNGLGIPQDVRDKIFEPFFTTKPTGTGTGLGLSLSYDVITKGHGGSLGLDGAEDEGATFVIRLPKA